MCFDLDSRPPIPPIAGAAVDGRTLEMESADGTRFLGYAADAAAPSGTGVLILPDVRGLHPFYEELALRFAESGIDALAMDYFGRTAGTAPRGGDFEFRDHVEQTRYPSLRADAQAAAHDLRRRRGVRNLFTVGFCFGGRLAFLAATHSGLDLAGAIGFYGPPAGAGRAGMPPPIDVVSEMRCPVLGLFGGADQGIPSEDVERFRRALAEAGVENELVVYPGAPHSFFDRKAEEHAEASADAWRRVQEFVRRISSAP
jgi:carboxymethylenebutenolidase